MKEFKDNAFDRADQLEQKLVEHRAISEKVLCLFLIFIRLNYITENKVRKFWEAQY